MRWSKATDPVLCGRGCMVLNAAGDDLTEKYKVKWADDETNQIGVYVPNGTGYGVEIQVLDVPGLRFIPGAG